MSTDPGYNGGITREQFLFHEMRITARLLNNGSTKEEALEKIKCDNLYQYPTEKSIKLIAGACFRRYDALGSQQLRQEIAEAVSDVGKQINLYAMMRYNRIVWDFMVTVIGEKYRTQSFDFTAADLNLFFFRLREQNPEISQWSDNTITKIKQVLKKCLVECSYLDTVRSAEINPVYLYPELEAGIRENGDLSAFPAFNHFE